MFIIFGMGQKKVGELAISGMYCPYCGSNADVILGKTIDSITIFFIPMIRWAIPFLECQRCNKNYQIKKDMYKGIKLGTVAPGDVQVLLRHMHEDDMRFQQQAAASASRSARETAIKYSQKSDKKIWVAALLSFFLGVVGAQNWYLRHWKRAILATAIFALGWATMFLIPYIFIYGLTFTSLWGIVDAVRIATGHATDSNGSYVMTKKQHAKRTGISIH